MDVPPTTPASLNDLLSSLQTPYYHRADFWIGAAIGAIGVGFSLAAFIEARSARIAAHAAVDSVKIQTIVLELSELVAQLGQIEKGTMSYSYARELILLLTKKLNRFLGPYETNPKFNVKIKEISKALTDVKERLQQLRPIAGQPDPDGTTIYYATEGGFSELSGLVSSLMGQMEHYSLEHSRYGK